MSDSRDARDDALRAWMQALAEIPVETGPLPDAHVLWWKAELLKQWDAQRQVMAPIERAEPIHVGIAFAGAALLLGSLWQAAPALPGALLVATILSVSVLVAVAAVTLRHS